MRDFTKPPGIPVRLALSALVLALSSSVPAGQSFVPAVAFAQAGGPATVDQTPAAVLAKYCITCHNEKRKTAGLMIDKLDLQHVGGDAEVWEKVVQKFRTHEMPPPGAPRPDKATYDAVTAHLERALDAAIAAKPNPGHVPVHRLNRTEYTNAIRDLLGLKIDGESLLIADEPDKHGFENIAGLLSVSPSRLERYLAAARKVSRLAVGDPTINPDCGDLHHSGGSRAGRSSQRGSSVRDAGRHFDRTFLSNRRRVQHQGSPATSGVSIHPGHGRDPRARCADRWCTGQEILGGR